MPNSSVCARRKFSRRTARHLRRPAPQAGIVVAPLGGVSPLTVVVGATTSGGTAPFTFSWHFSDGGSASGLTASHTFTSMGAFTIDLAATDSLGSVATASASVVVENAMTVTLTASPPTLEVGQSTTLLAVAAGGSHCCHTAGR